MRRMMLARAAVVLVLAATGAMAGPATAAAETIAHPQQFVTVGGMDGDYVHLSRRGSSIVASAHGWWTWPETTALKAKVTVQLQANLAGTWTDVGPLGRATVGPGTGGSGRRANAWVICRNAVSTEWRSVVDADIIGKLDSPNKYVSPAQRIDCGV